VRDFIAVCNRLSQFPTKNYVKTIAKSGSAMTAWLRDSHSTISKVAVKDWAFVTIAGEGPELPGQSFRPSGIVEDHSWRA